MWGVKSIKPKIQKFLVGGENDQNYVSLISKAVDNLSRFFPQLGNNLKQDQA